MYIRRNRDYGGVDVESAKLGCCRCSGVGGAVRGASGHNSAAWRDRGACPGGRVLEPRLGCHREPPKKGVARRRLSTGSGGVGSKVSTGDSGSSGSRRRRSGSSDDGRVGATFPHAEAVRNATAIVASRRSARDVRPKNVPQLLDKARFRLEYKLVVLRRAAPRGGPLGRSCSGPENLPQLLDKARIRLGNDRDGLRRAAPRGAPFGRSCSRSESLPQLLDKARFRLGNERGGPGRAAPKVRPPWGALCRSIP